jgi:hypothetical protein
VSINSLRAITVCDGVHVVISLPFRFELEIGSLNRRFRGLRELTPIGIGCKAALHPELRLPWTPFPIR